MEVSRIPRATLCEKRKDPRGAGVNREGLAANTSREHVPGGGRPQGKEETIRNGDETLWWNRWVKGEKMEGVGP